MAYLGIDMVTNMDEFMKLVDQARNNVAPGPGWGVWDLVECPFCLAEYTLVAPLGATGVTCPFCGCENHETIWLPEEGLDEGSSLFPVGWQHARINLN
jgi:hypothetical protein